MSEQRERRFPNFLDRVAWLLLGGYALICVLVWAEPAWRPEWDGGIYLLTARSLALGEGYRYAGEAFFLRPPGLAWMLSFFVDADGGISHAAVNRFLMAWAAASVVAIFWALRRSSGTGPALLVALLTGTAPLYVRNFNWVLSEFPCTALLFAAIGCLHGASRKGGRWWAWALVGALCLAGAAYLRTVAILLIPGVLLFGLRREGGLWNGRAWLPVALAVACLAPWFVWAGRAADGAVVPPDQLKLHDYSTAMWHEDPGDPASPLVSLESWGERLAQNGASLARDLSDSTLHVESAAVGCVLLLLLLLGWLVRLRRSPSFFTPSLFEWFAAVYAALVLTYFAWAERLLLPLVPFLYLYLWTVLGAGSRRLARWLGRPRLAVAAQALVVTALLLLNVWNLPARLSAEDWDLKGATLGQRWADLETVADWLTENSPEDAVILCVRAPSLAVLSGREAYTHSHPRGRNLIGRYKPDYVIFDAGASPREIEGLAGRARAQWKLVGAGTGVSIPVFEMRRGRPRPDG